MIYFFMIYIELHFSSFVIFDKIEGWLKGDFERDCNLKCFMEGIEDGDNSQGFQLHFNCKALYFICEPCRASTSLIEKTSPLIIPFFKAIGYRYDVIIQNCKLYLNCVVWSGYKCWNLYTRGFDEVGDITSSIKKIARVENDIGVNDCASVKKIKIWQL